MRSSNRLVIGATPARGASVAPARPSSGERATIVDLRIEPPVHARLAGGRVLFGASAAGPVGGDDIEIDVAIEPGVAADVGTVGATMVLPSRCGAASRTATAIRVGAGAHLRWRPEPTISVAGSQHTASLVVDLDDAATCHVVEEVALGRSGEASGSFASVLRVERAGWPLVHHAECFGPEQAGAGSVAAGPSAGHLITVVGVGPAPPLEPIVLIENSRWGGRMPIAADVELVTVVAPDRPEALAVCRQLGVEL